MFTVGQYVYVPSGMGGIFGAKIIEALEDGHYKAQVLNSDYRHWRFPVKPENITPMDTQSERWYRQREREEREREAERKRYRLRGMEM